MSDYKKKPIKNAANAVKQLALQSSDKIITPITAKWPQLGLALSVLAVELNFKLAYHQEELNDFIEHFKKEYENGNLQIDLQSRAFTDALTIAVEQYFKLRIDEKREVAKKIFVECAKSPSLPQFPLERLNNTLQLISLEGLQYLAFLDKEIMPLREQAIQQQLSTGNFPPPPQGQPKEWWYENFQRTEPVSNYIDKWVSEVYDPPELANVTQAIAEKKEELKQLKRNDLSENAIEMEQLGLMRTYQDGAGIGGGGTVYNLTRFGKAFKTFVPK